MVQQRSFGLRERDPSLAPDPPVAFWVVQAGSLGPVLSFHGGKLYSKTLLGPLLEAVHADVSVFPAVVEWVKGGMDASYCLVRPSCSVRYEDAGQPYHDAPLIAYLQDLPSCLVVNSALRERLDALRLPGLFFEEPILFVGIGDLNP